MAVQGTFYVTNMHIIYNPQFVYQPDSKAESEGNNQQLESGLKVSYHHHCCCYPAAEKEPEKPTRRTISTRKLAKGWKVGLKYIDNIESTLEGKHFSINLYCKDYNVIQLSSLPGHTEVTRQLFCDWIASKAVTQTHGGLCRALNADRRELSETGH